MISGFKIALVACTVGMLAFPWQSFAQAVTPLSIVDQRTVSSLEGHRDSNFSAIIFLPERAVKPGPTVQLRDAILKRTARSMSVVISELQIVDYFPRRIKAGPDGWFNNAVMKRLVNSKTDWAFIDGIGISNEEDSVIVLFSGTVNGQEVEIATHSPYRLGGFSAMVRSDKNFKAAVTRSIEQVAQKIVDQANDAQAPQ